MRPVLLWLLVFGLVFGGVKAAPALHHNSDAHAPLGVSEWSGRLAALAQREQDARLALPTPQEIEAIKKVAQILIMLGEQVIPTIIGEQPPASPPDCHKSAPEASLDTTS